MARQQVREVSAPSAIQGIATPVSSYVRPAEPGRSQLHDLAAGLAAFDAGLGGYLNKKKAETEDADKARAIVDFNRNNQVGWVEAVRQGLVPASSSPVYMESYKKAQGNLTGLRYGDKFSLDYQSWEGRHDADSDAYAAWVANWMKENVGDEQDPHVLSGLAPHLERITVSGYGTFMKERDDRITEGARATTGATITHALTETLDEGRASGNTDWNAFWDKTMQIRAEALARGEQEVPVDKLIVDSILLQAERTSDMEVLKLLDKKLPGKEHPMNFDPKVREEMTKTQDRIKAAQGAMGSEIARERERQEKAQQEEWYSEAYATIYQGKEVPEELIVKLSRRDGEARHKLAQVKKQFMSGGSQEDPHSILQVYADIDQGAGKDYVRKMMDLGVIKDPATFTKAIDRVEAVKKATAEGGVFTSPTYKDTVKLLTREAGLSELAAKIDGDMPISPEAYEALYDYRQMLLDWDKRNPDASMMEKEKAAREMGDVIRNRLKPDPNDTYVNIYQSEAKKAEADARAAQEADQSAQEADRKAQAAQDEASYKATDSGGWFQDALRAAGDVLGITGNEKMPPALETQSPARRSAVEAISKRHGVSLDEANRLFQEELDGLTGGDGVDPTTTNSISSQTRGDLQSLFDNPPTRQAGGTASLRDLIASAEGTEGGGRRSYNETLGHGALTGGDVEITSMTLDEVDALQSKMLRHPDNKWNSSAVGRYQTVQQTLRDARTALGLKGSDKYDAATQDRVADWLLERRGLRKVLRGKMTPSAFIQSMGGEWEAFAPGIRGSKAARSALHQALGTQRNGSSRLVTSNKRGYQPDLDHLKPDLKNRVASLQAAWGRDLPIVSGFRDAARNKKAGGAKHSQHQHGNAVDIDVSSLSKADRVNLIRLASQQGFTGIGVYANSLHLDRGRRRYWGPSHHGGSLPGWAKAAIQDHMGRKQA
ncbi:hypothetical protein K32_42220 [Kaistia sp. 32K]|uniref:D-Ala-D-Ala carboxypeptidase family metallohydrolase n=1 Tax=Kaistia sp. 32K TaxID=2795690 RepID=UPI0019157EDF|nr:D-Ala-D-Ala carboxypeptidase family metallohydrolase [Kaistia sp. 32K]BCP55605.1 hypothetical protein K32_42220 [Kaistia sp. 32K]